VPQPVLYLHGTNDGCHGVTQEQVDRVVNYGGPGRRAADRGCRALHDDGWVAASTGIAAVRRVAAPAERVPCVVPRQR
jgi:hypothetical protein